MDKEPKPAREPDWAVVSDFPATPAPPIEPVVFTAALEGLSRNLTETEPAPSPFADSAAVSAFPAPLTPPVKPVVSAVVSPPPAPYTLPTQNPDSTAIHDKELTHKKVQLREASALIVELPAPQVTTS